MAKETFWFKHDYDAADDDKTMLLIEQLGLEGYGIYWILYECFRRIVPVAGRVLVSDVWHGAFQYH